MDASNDVFVRRYSKYSTLKQPIFLFDVALGLLTKVQHGNPVTGWLIDYEIVISGKQQVVFFSMDGRKYIAFGNNVYPCSDKDLTYTHRRGLFVSRFVVKSVDSILDKTVYLTPWWRLLFDDGSHPDSNFPIEYFFGKWKSLD